MNDNSRTEFDIIDDTLNAIKKTEKKTHLMNKAGLNTKYHDKVISYLQKVGFITKNGNGNGKPYEVLEKGEMFQEMFVGLRALLKPTKPYPSSI